MKEINEHIIISFNIIMGSYWLPSKLTIAVMPVNVMRMLCSYHIIL